MDAQNTSSGSGDGRKKFGYAAAMLMVVLGVITGVIAAAMALEGGVNPSAWALVVIGVASFVVGTCWTVLEM